MKIMLMVVEFVDCTLDKYIKTNSFKLTRSNKRLIINQILRLFRYIRSKGFLSTDVSLKYLIKEYDVNTIKVSD